MQNSLSFDRLVKGGFLMIYADRKSLKIPFGERIICRFGDNAVDRIYFEIGEDYAECSYVLYILFSDGSINSILLEKEDEKTAVWNVESKHIFSSGIAYIQLKAISSIGEIWHTPEATVEFLGSIEEKSDFLSEDEIAENGEREPTILEQLEEKIEEINDLLEDILAIIEARDYITRPQAEHLVWESIDELVLPLGSRLDGVDITA